MSQSEFKDFDFMGYRPYFLGFSLLLIVGTVIAFLTMGPKWGTDFEGGTEVEINFTKPVDVSTLRDTVTKLGFHSPEVVSVSDADMPHRFLIRVKDTSKLEAEGVAAVQHALCELEGELEGKPTEDYLARCPEGMRTEEVKVSPGGDKISARYLPSDKFPKGVCGERRGDVTCPPRDDIAKALDGRPGGVELRVGDNNPVVQNQREGKVEYFLKSKGDQILDGLIKELGADTVPATPLRVEWIGPKAGEQLRDAAIKSILIAIIFIMVYIAFRFDMRFAPGAIVALIHDVFLAMGAMVIAQREVTLATVAALLTIVGYSINDTVVVYDRIRENLGRYRKMNFPAIINRSVTEMLGRTLRTSVTTIMVLAPFLVIGTGVIKDFAFAMTVGVVVGTYSSIYVAAPVTEFIDRRIFGTAVKKKRRVKRRKKDGPPSTSGATASV